MSAAEAEEAQDAAGKESVKDHFAYRKDAKLTTHVNAELPDWASNC